MHKQIVMLVALVTALAVPAAAQAVPPSKTDKTNAAKQCRAERGDTDATREAFAQEYGTNANKKNAFGKCVSRKAREEQGERRAAKRKAQRACRAERKSNKRKAFAKCVARKARAEKRKMDRADRQARIQRRNAAQECDDERGDTPESRAAFAETYGTNANDSNAFGKCVSQKARA